MGAAVSRRETKLLETISSSARKLVQSDLTHEHKPDSEKLSTTRFSARDKERTPERQFLDMKTRQIKPTHEPESSSNVRNAIYLRSGCEALICGKLSGFPKVTRHRMPQEPSVSLKIPPLWHKGPSRWFIFEEIHAQENLIGDTHQ